MSRVPSDASSGTPATIFSTLPFAATLTVSANNASDL
jgi:hypothetical protein